MADNTVPETVSPCSTFHWNSHDSDLNAGLRELFRKAFYLLYQEILDRKDGLKLVEKIGVVTGNTLDTLATDLHSVGSRAIRDINDDDT